MAATEPVKLSILTIPPIQIALTHPTYLHCVLHARACIDQKDVADFKCVFLLRFLFGCKMENRR